MRKYEKGERIISLDVLMEQEFVYLYDKVYHKGWVRGWQVGWLAYHVQIGVVHKAVKKNVPVSSVYFLTEDDFITQEVMDNAMKKHEKTLKTWMDGVKGIKQ